MPKATADAPVMVAPPTEASPEALAIVQATLDAQLVTLYASLPARTAVVMFTGHSDPRRMASLNARKVAFESAITSRKKAEKIDRPEWWTAIERRALEEVEKAKRGMLFWGCHDQVNLCVRMVIAVFKQYTSTLRGRWHIVFQRMPFSALLNTFRSCRGPHRSEWRTSIREVTSLG